MTGSLRIERMTRAEIGRAVDWAAREGWNPGYADADCFAVVDPEGFIGGYLGDRMIASISVVNYDPSFSFLGFYIVDPEFRGHGYGFRLWEEAIGHAAGRLIGLDGVVAEQDNYRRSGFELAYRNIRYGGVPEGLATEGEPGVDITQIEAVTPELSNLDRQMFPAARASFLNAWISAPEHRALGACRAGSLVGYGVVRPCRSGWKVGPLFAEDAAVARALLSALVESSGSDKVTGEIFLDVPEPNAQAVQLAKSAGLSPVFETARMYTGAAPDIALESIFGVTTFELG